MQGKRLVHIILICFVLAAIGTTIFAWSVVSGVRKDARFTTARLRLLTDAVVQYSAQSGGFPLGAEELLDGGDPHARRAMIEALSVVRVEWPIDRTVEPILRVDGRPTEAGALGLAAEALSQAASAVRARTRVPPPTR